MPTTKYKKKPKEKENTVEKATEGDKRRILSKAVEKKFSEETEDYCCYGRHYAYMCDYDDSYVYWDIYKEGNYATYKTSYTFSGTSATLGDDLVEVVANTEYEEVSGEEVDKSLVDRVVKAVSKHFGGSNRQVVKSYDSEMITVEPLYIGAYEVDGVGDAYYNSDECYAMVDNLNKASVEANYFHKAMTDDFEVVEAFCNRVETVVEGTDVTIPADQPVVVLKYNNEATFNLRKSGELMGPSIGARAEEIIDIDTGKVISKNADIILGSDFGSEEAVVKRLLKGINFDFDGSHVALTEKSQGGACSLKNEFYLAKANEKKVLTKEQKDLLEKMDHDISEIEKSMEEVNSNQETKGTDDIMSEDLKQEVVELRKQLSEAKIQKALSKYELDADLEKELVKVLEPVEDPSVVYKVFDALIKAGDEKTEDVLKQAEEAHKEELDKSNGASDNPLKKDLEKEAGEGGKPDGEVEKSRSDRIAEYLDKAKQSK